MHAAVRHLIKARNELTPGMWHPDWGTPINQEDLAGTLLSFSYVVADPLRRLGVRVGAKDVDAYLHLWNVIGHLLGVRDELLVSDAADAAALKNYKGHIDKATRFIPLWVKVAVAIALGLGTMVGWKRIVVTVGEKIGKNHLTYAQGAAAEITAMATIGAADYFGLPVSTTHVLSSGVAGTMAANHSGLQWGTVRNLLMAWVLTLPVAMTLSGLLFWTFRKIF